MAFFTDITPDYIRIRILLVLLLAVVVGLAALLSPVLGEGGALLVGFGMAVVGVLALLAVYALRR